MSIPQFSTHTIVIRTPASTTLIATSSKASTVSSTGIPASYFTGAVVVVAVVVVAAVFAVRSQRNKKMDSVGSSSQ